MTGDVRKQLDELLSAVVPRGCVGLATDALLADRSPVVPRDVYDADVRREVEWGHHIGDQRDAAQLEVSRLRSKLDLTAVARVNAVRALVADVDGGRSGTHDETCHRRHTGCLARRVREALGGEA